MALFLVDPALELSIELPVSEPIERALAIQWERLQDSVSRDNFCRRIAQQLGALIPDSIDWDLKSPTPAQLSFALVISKQLGIALPSDAICYRGSMHAFLEEHAPLLKARTQSAVSLAVKRD